MYIYKIYFHGRDTQKRAQKNKRFLRTQTYHPVAGIPTTYKNKNIMATATYPLCSCVFTKKSRKKKKKSSPMKTSLNIYM